jgi:hypothetical protein
MLQSSQVCKLYSTVQYNTVKYSTLFPLIPFLFNFLRDSYRKTRGWGGTYLLRNPQALGHLALDFVP